LKIKLIIILTVEKQREMTDLGFIVKMVIYKCRELGNPVTETLAAYVAQTTLNKRKSHRGSGGCLTYYKYRHRQILPGRSSNGRGGEEAR
jgi:hypothetical protein